MRTKTMNTMLLKKLDFDLAYLVLLTLQGVKPLSRWEEELSDEKYSILKELGFKTALVDRRLRSGQKVNEIIFGLSQAYLDIYFKNFHDAPISKSLDTQYIEGFLFEF